MGLIEDLLGGNTLLQIQRSYWAAKLNDGSWLSEAWVKTDVRVGGRRHYDWTNDLVATGDVERVTELWLLCPSSAPSPQGNTVRVPIHEPGTAFQFKRGAFNTNIVQGRKLMIAQAIGRLDDKATGEAVVFLWDQLRFALFAPWYVNLYDPHGLGAWRDDTLPVPALEFRQLGIRV